MHHFILLKYEDFSPIIDEFKGTTRNTEAFRTFIQHYIDKVTVYPYHLEIVLNTGLEIADELNEAITYILPTVENAVNAKIYCIDSEEYCTMLLAEEY